MTQKVWKNFISETGEVHTTPVNDLIVHKYEGCECGPETIPVECDDGGIAWQIVHNAQDGRD